MADLENAAAFTVYALSTAPLPRILTGMPIELIRAGGFQRLGGDFVRVHRARSARLTTWNSFLKILVKPDLGRRRCSGICPPSKPRLC